jgi:hypothetical protein
MLHLKLLLLQLTVIASMWLPATAVAGQNVYGGWIRDSRGVVVDVGYPGASVALRPNKRDFADISIGVGVDYGAAAAQRTGASLFFRWRNGLYVNDLVSVAFTTALPIRVTTGGALGTTLSLGLVEPGVLTTVRLPTTPLDINLGVRWTPSVSLRLDDPSDGPVFAFPGALPFRVGAEYGVADNIQLAFNADVGPVLSLVGNTGVAVDVRVGAAFDF